MRKIKLTHIFITFVLHYTFAQEATLYDNVYYDGPSVQIPIGSCRNVFDFNDRASSIQTNGCIRLWEHRDCTGRQREIDAPGNDNLVDLNFNDAVTSVSDCKVGGVSEYLEVNLDFSKDSDSRVVEYGNKVRPIMQSWFPLIQNILTSPYYRPTKKVTVAFDPNPGTPVAWAKTEENRIEVNTGYLKGHLDDTGMMIHELTHIVQKPLGGCPGWVVEGFAEYTRRWHFEPKTTANKPKAQDNMNEINPYLGDWLLAYLESYFGKEGKPMMYLINRACQDGSYNDNFLRDMTGKSDVEWWNQMLNDNEFPWKRL